MTQEEKSFLLKDLCARLPYGVKVHIKGEYHKYHDVEEIDISDECVRYFENWHLYEEKITDCRLYLRPMSSMTEEEKRHISKMMCLRTYDDGVVHDMTYPVYTPYYVMEDCLSYLRSIHIDYSGLIEKNLALEAKEGMYELKENNNGKERQA